MFTLHFISRLQRSLFRSVEQTAKGCGLPEAVGFGRGAFEKISQLGWCKHAQNFFPFPLGWREFTPTYFPFRKIFASRCYELGTLPNRRSQALIVLIILSIDNGMWIWKGHY